MAGKIIVIEGTDCSGKQTQSELLLNRLTKDGYKVAKFSFPNYESPTGKIVGGPYLGKETIANSWFKEGAINVDPRVSSLYFAADRLYNIEPINELIKQNYIVLLDRYVYSNMAHQGGKLHSREERFILYNFLDKLEFDLLELPRLDIGLFLHVPYEYAKQLKTNRTDLDEHEKSEEHLKAAEQAYLEIYEKYNFYKINCIDNNQMRSIDDINEEIYQYKKKII